MDYGALEYKIQNSEISENNKKVLLSDLEKIGIFSMENEKLEKINQRYEVLMELESMKNDFLSNKSNLSTISSLKIARLINEFENKKQLGITDLNILSRSITRDQSLVLRKEIFGVSIGNSYRDFVKQNIDFKGIPENIYENDFLKDFYQVFSVKYRIFIENKYGNVMDFDNEKGLLLTKFELLNIIGETLKEVYGKKGKDYKEIKYTVLFNLNNGEQVIQDIFKPDDSKKSIKNMQLVNMQVDKNATDKKDIKVRNNTNKGKSSADKLNISKQIDKKDINASKPKLQKLPIIEREKILNIGKKLKQEESKEGFLYADFIEKYGLSESSKKLLGELLKENLVGEKATVRVDLGDGKYIDKTITYTNNKNPKPDELNISQNLGELINNLEKTIVLTLKVESSGGRNVPNYNNSGAEGYFQLHTKNGKIGYEKLVGDLYVEISKSEYLELEKKNKTEFDTSKKITIRTVKKYNSYETAINLLAKRYKKLAKNGKIKVDIIGGKEIDLKHKSITGIKGPLELNAEEQTNLWLVDLFSRIKDDRKQHLANMLIGSQWDAKQFYNKVQHTAPKADTAEVVNSFMVHAGKMKIIV